jgi:hypothetical protein
MYPFPNYFNNLIRDRNIPFNDEIIHQHRSVVVEHIWRAFDFQELKYVWDFESRSPITIFRQAINTINSIIHHLTQIETNLDIQISIQGGNRLVGKLDEIEANFLEKYNDPKVVTISGEDEADSFWTSKNPSTLQYSPTSTMLPFMFEKTAKSYQFLIPRIFDYQEKGFEINDPGHIMTTVHATAIISVIVSLFSADLDKVERKALFNSSHDVKKNYRFLSKLRKLIEDNKDELGLDDSIFDRSNLKENLKKEDVF